MDRDDQPAAVDPSPRINWIEQLFLPLILIVIVTTWFNAAAAWLIRSAGGGFSVTPPTVGMHAAVLLLSTMVTRFALSGRTARPRVVVLGAGLITLLAVSALTYRGTDYLRDLLLWRGVVSPELIVVMSTAALWWRGILIGRSAALVDEDLDRSFYNGILVFVVLLYFNRLTEFVPAAELLTAILVFFAASLTMLTVVSIERARLNHTDPGFQFNRHWITTIIAVVGAILAGALALAAIVSPDAVRQFGQTLQPVFAGAGRVLAAVLVFLADLLGRILEPLVPLILGIIRGIMSFLGQFAEFLNNLGLKLDTDVFQQIDQFLNSPQVQAVTRGSLVVVVLIVFAVLMIWGLVRVALLVRRPDDETHESIASRELLLSQLREWWRRLRTPAPAAVPLYLALSGDDARTTVRRVYQELLEWARIRGRARQPHQTPGQYAVALRRDRAALAEPLEVITHAYERARYSIEPLTPDDARAAQESLITLQAASVIKSSLEEQ